MFFESILACEKIDLGFESMISYYDTIKKLIIDIINYFEFTSRFLI